MATFNELKDKLTTSFNNHFAHDTARAYFQACLTEWKDQETRFETTDNVDYLFTAHEFDIFQAIRAYNIVISENQPLRQTKNETNTTNSNTQVYSQGDVDTTAKAYPTGYTGDTDEPYLTSSTNQHSADDTTKDNGTSTTTSTNTTIDAKEQIDLINSRNYLMQSIQRLIFDLMGNTIQGAL